MNKEQKYRNWKAGYILRHKREKKLYLLKLGIAILVIILLYSWYTGRLKFFAQPTDYTKGVITKTKPWRTAPNGALSIYIQHASYTYKVDGKIYTEGFFPSRSIGRLHEGDTVKVKFSKFFNSLSEVVEVLHCTKTISP